VQDNDTQAYETLTWKPYLVSRMAPSTRMTLSYLEGDFGWKTLQISYFGKYNTHGIR